MEIIRAEHVARLLRTEDGDPVLIVHRGRADVVEAGALDDPHYEGALRLADRSDLAGERGGGEATQEEVEVLARRLDTAVRNLGG